jgi:hypothetical protein
MPSIALRATADKPRFQFKDGQHAAAFCKVSKGSASEGPTVLVAARVLQSLSAPIEGVAAQVPCHNWVAVAVMFLSSLKAGGLRGRRIGDPRGIAQWRPRGSQLALLGPPNYCRDGRTNSSPDRAAAKLHAADGLRRIAILLDPGCVLHRLGYDLI